MTGSRAEGARTTGVVAGFLAAAFVALLGTAPTLHAADVDVTPLDAPDPESAGLIRAEQAGFGTRPWAESNRVRVARLVSELPSGYPSPTISGLAMRALTVNAPAPPGPTTSPTLAEERVLALRRAGRLDQAARLASLLDDTLRTGPVLDAEREARLLLYDVPAACAVTHEAVARRLEGHWLETLAFCQVVDGQETEAELTTTLLHEMGDSEPAFFRLLRAVEGRGDDGIETTARPSPLQLAMLRTASIELAPDTEIDRNPGIARAVARAPNAPIDLRIAAAETAYRAGALAADVLESLYQFRAASMEHGSDGLAAHIATAARPSDPAARVHAVLEAWRAARERFPAAPAAVLVARELPPPEPETTARLDGEDLANTTRIALGAGRFEAVQAWADALARRAADGEPFAVGAYARLVPLAILAGLMLEEDADVGLDALPERRDDAVMSPTGTYAILLDGLGEMLAPPLRRRIEAELPRLPRDDDVERMLDRLDDVRPNQTAEAALAVARALDGGQRLDDLRLVRGALQTLRRTGLDADARRLAVEVALETGL